MQLVGKSLPLLQKDYELCYEHALIIYKVINANKS